MHTEPEFAALCRAALAVLAYDETRDGVLLTTVRTDYSPPRPGRTAGYYYPTYAAALGYWPACETDRGLKYCDEADEAAERLASHAAEGIAQRISEARQVPVTFTCEGCGHPGTEMMEPEDEECVCWKCYHRTARQMETTTALAA